MKRAELFKSRDQQGTLLIDLELTDAPAIRLGWFDMRSDDAMGGDVERDIVVPASALPALCFELMRLTFTGKSDAMATMRQLCRGAGIDFEETGWN